MLIDNVFLNFLSDTQNSQGLATIKLVGVYEECMTSLTSFLCRMCLCLCRQGRGQNSLRGLRDE